MSASLVLGVLVASLATAPVREAPPSLTLLFTGDNGGEIAPCG